MLQSIQEQDDGKEFAMTSTAKICFRKVFGNTSQTARNTLKIAI